MTSALRSDLTTETGKNEELRTLEGCASPRQELPATGLNRQGLTPYPRTSSWGGQVSSSACVTHRGSLGGSDTQDVAGGWRGGGWGT